MCIYESLAGIRMHFIIIMLFKSYPYTLLSMRIKAEMTIFTSDSMHQLSVLQRTSFKRDPIFH